MRLRNSRVMKFTQDFEVKEKMILRDYLALQRTKLANERTLLTYVKSAIYLIIAGIAFINVKEFEHIPFLGYFCFIVSALLFIIGIIRFFQLKKQINIMYKEGVDFDK